jgi:hypothetical protein
MSATLQVVKQTAENGIGKGKPGPGRPKGVPNKATTALKDMILKALDEAHPDGGIEYLKLQAGENPTAFLSLVGKVLPTTLQGDPANPIFIDLSGARQEVAELFGPTPHLIEKQHG